MRHVAFTMAALFAAVALAGCSTSGPSPRTDALPLTPQSSKRYQCGPSTLASVMAFHGVKIPEETISEAIYSPTARGVLLSDIAWYAREQGFQAEITTGSINDLKRAVEDGHPPIVLLDLGIAGIQRPHFTAITGLTDDGVLYIGNKRSDEYSSFRFFRRQWNRAGNQYLVILPSP